MRDEHAVITHHEAGHTVAALITVNNGINDEISVALANGKGFGTSNLLISGGHPAQAAFVLYAGPWAEARVQWSGAVLQSLDDANAVGETFRQTVGAAFREGRGIGQTSDHAMYTALMEIDPALGGNEPQWSNLLERAWPVVKLLADSLRSRFEPPFPFESGQLTYAMESAVMPGDQVVELVRPRLEAIGMWRSLS